ncbi:unnamed protein product [Choristocarpus tenellus]
MPVVDADLAEDHPGVDTDYLVSSASGGGCTAVTSFVRKLYQMVNREHDSVVAFITDGSAFEVKDPRKLEQDILPKYFRHSRFQSLVRQLNFYSFKKISKERSVWIYKHALFRRDEPELLHALKRKTNQHGGGLSPPTVASEALDRCSRGDTNHLPSNNHRSQSKGPRPRAQVLNSTSPSNYRRSAQQRGSSQRTSTATETGGAPAYASIVSPPNENSFDHSHWTRTCQPNSGSGGGVSRSAPLQLQGSSGGGSGGGTATPSVTSRQHKRTASQAENEVEALAMWGLSALCRVASTESSSDGETTTSSSSLGCTSPTHSSGIADDDWGTEEDGGDRQHLSRKRACNRRIVPLHKITTPLQTDPRLPGFQFDQAVEEEALSSNDEGGDDLVHKVYQWHAESGEEEEDATTSGSDEDDDEDEEMDICQHHHSTYGNFSIASSPALPPSTHRGKNDYSSNIQRDEEQIQHHAWATHEDSTVSLGDLNHVSSGTPPACCSGSHRDADFVEQLEKPSGEIDAIEEKVPWLETKKCAAVPSRQDAEEEVQAEALVGLKGISALLCPRHPPTISSDSHCQGSTALSSTNHLSGCDTGSSGLCEVALFCAGPAGVDPASAPAEGLAGAVLTFLDSKDDALKDMRCYLEALDPAAAAVLDGCGGRGHNSTHRSDLWGSSLDSSDNDDLGDSSGRGAGETVLKRIPLLRAFTQYAVCRLGGAAETIADAASGAASGAKADVANRVRYKLEACRQRWLRAAVRFA